MGRTIGNDTDRELLQPISEYARSMFTAILFFLVGLAVVIYFAET
jgi:hypothetical protein